MFNSREHGRLETIQRRVLHLEKALAGDWLGRSPDRARAECSALRWLLRIVESDHDRTLGEIVVLVRHKSAEAAES